MLDYAPIGPRFSNFVLQTLKLLFKKIPPKGRKLLLIATTSEKQLVKDLGLYSSFSKVVHVPNVSRGPELLNVLDQLEAFPRKDMDFLSRQLKDKTCSIGIKTLLDVIELSKQATDQYKVAKFVNTLEDVAGLHDNDEE